MTVRLQGIIPPVPTMIGADGRFDPQAMGRLIDFLLASEVDALFFLGSAGEFAQLSNGARRQVAEYCVARVAGRIAVGYRADLSSFGLDPLAAGPDEFAQAPVPLTVVDGAIVHRAD